MAKLSIRNTGERRAGFRPVRRRSATLAQHEFGGPGTRLGVDRSVVERCFQHSLGEISDASPADDRLERRRAAHVLVGEHWAAGRTGKAARVLPLRGGRA